MGLGVQNSGRMDLGLLDYWDLALGLRSRAQTLEGSPFSDWGSKFMDLANGTRELSFRVWSLGFAVQG